MSTHEQDTKMIEKMLEREAKSDAAALKHAVKDLEAAEKAEVKAENMVDKAIHAHEKTVRKEHDAAKALNKAQHAHGARVADEQSALKTIEIKKQHQSRLEQDVEAKKALRDQKIAQLHTRTGTGGTTASDPAAQNVNIPVAQSPATTVGPSAA
ncbi:pneumovirus matrix domain-containing protein [Rhizoctonia solani AG-1 IA]|uniref:Pneumovirus matrix domain-containing protein n=1 Tax=Thanatephorus cucumeris (strain AG1-IA) TaxID=983506 RepID=L8WTS1_THACA|nr:pneumovirus matrix domain-containing protein [Rhizoctonia solani AG-1 IA]